MIETPVLRLYSASPRRRDLLTQVGLPFVVNPLEADETPSPRASAPEAVQEIALRKLHIGLGLSVSHRNEWGLAADTLVEGVKGVLGKPDNRYDARRMIRELSGKNHRVHTGLALYAPKSNRRIESKIVCTVHSTDVRFRALTETEIDSYIECGEWRGAAGAYRIQGRGAFLVEEITGLWSTVVGLPLGPLYGILSAAQYPFG